MSFIRKATSGDIPQIAAIYEHILDREEQGPTATGWVRGVYPTKATALEALKAGELFVLLEEDHVAAAGRINQLQAPEYAQATWHYPHIPAEQIMVLHTLVVSPSFAGKGLGTTFVHFYEQYAREQGCTCLRMDTNVKNTAARKLYAHLGFQEAGIVDCIFNGIPDLQLVCLEKKLEG
ncbi:MAG: GNAT family N-acetyltransferase [Lachnospiraceae bacterium]|jgi:GNAT superfamily N-acetyltransferase|nr:GNAT family N-acetyltransferase [Lachnospiraceae bacterium]